MVEIRLNHLVLVLPGVEDLRCCERPGSKPTLAITLAIAHSSFRSFSFRSVSFLVVELC